VGPLHITGILDTSAEGATVQQIRYLVAADSGTPTRGGYRRLGFGRSAAHDAAEPAPQRGFAGFDQRVKRQVSESERVLAQHRTGLITLG
jgi:hypothetical protein